MIDKLTLIGGDHFDDRRSYWDVYEQLDEIEPDVITLEKSLSPGGFVPIPFMDGADEFEQKGRDNPQIVMGPFEAGIVYAIRNGIGLYAIDYYFPNTGYWDTNLTENNGWQRFTTKRNDLDRFFDKINRKIDKFCEKAGESRYHQWTRRNKTMAKAIQRLHKNKGYDNFVQIGGSGHYDAARCKTFQDLVKAKGTTIIDVVEKTIIPY